MAATKTVVKKKPVAKVEPDLIAKSATVIEKLTKDKAFAMVTQLLDDSDFNLFKVGGALAVIQDNGWYNDEGFSSLKEFVESRYDMEYRKAMYWIAIYKALVESGVPWTSVKGLGWSKLRLIASVLTLENVDEYVELAKDMTQRQLAEYVKSQKKGSLDSNKTDDDSEPTTQQAVADAKKVTTMTFKVHEDQKEIIREAIDTAKNDADTEFDTVALEAICMSYISGNGGAQLKQPLEAAMKKAGYAGVFDVFETLWPDIELSVTIPDGMEDDEVDADDTDDADGDADGEEEEL